MGLAARMALRMVLSLGLADHAVVLTRRRSELLLPAQVAKYPGVTCRISMCSLAYPKQRYPKLNTPNPALVARPGHLADLVRLFLLVPTVHNGSISSRSGLNFSRRFCR